MRERTQHMHTNIDNEPTPACTRDALHDFEADFVLRREQPERQARLPLNTLSTAERMANEGEDDIA